MAGIAQGNLINPLLVLIMTNDIFDQVSEDIDKSVFTDNSHLEERKGACSRLQINYRK